MYTPEIRNTLDMGSFTLSVGNENVFATNKFGFVEGISADTTSDIWDVGGELVYLTTATTLDIVSTSTDDVQTTGTGAWNVVVYGLDTNGNLIQEVVPLNGTTPVSTTLEFLRVYRMAVAQSGSSDNAVGTIDATGGGNIQARIEPGVNITRMSHFTVPAGYRGFITGIYTSGGPNDDYVAQLRIRPPGPEATFITVSDIEISNSNLFSAQYSLALGPFPAMTDIKGITTSVGGNITTRANYSIVCIRDEYLDRYVAQMK